MPAHPLDSAAVLRAASAPRKFARGAKAGFHPADAILQLGSRADLIATQAEIAWHEGDWNAARRRSTRPAVGTYQRWFRETILKIEEF